jgi:hypothetical protein
MIERLDRILTHPVTVVTAAVGTLASLVQVPVLSALVGVIWAKAGTIFAVVSVSISQLGPQIGIEPSTQQAVLLVAGALYIGRLLDKLWDAVEVRLRNR